MKITRLPLISVICAALLCVSLNGQDCGKINLSPDLLNIKSDSAAIAAVLDWPNNSEQICWLQKRTSEYFKSYQYKKALRYATTLERSLEQASVKDSLLLFKNWEILSNSYFEMGLPDSTIHYGKKLLWAMDQRILSLPASMPRILEIVAMSYADKLQYDLALEWIDLFLYHLLDERLDDQEMYFEVLYVKGVIFTRQVKLEKADSFMSVVHSEIESIGINSSVVEFRILTLQIRLKLFLGKLDKSKEKIIRCKEFLKSTRITDSSNYISFLMNQSYYFLIIGDFEKSKLFALECLNIAKGLERIPVLYPKVKMFAAINLIEAGEIDESINYIREAIDYLESGLFLTIVT